MSWILIEPLDVVLFRDSKPFAAGESHRAKSTFPPNTLPLVGALKSKILVEHSIDFAIFRVPFQHNALRETQQKVIQKIGGPDGYGNLQLKGPFLVKTKSNGSQIEIQDFYFPLPLNLLERGELLPLEQGLPGVGYSPPWPDGLRPLWIRREAPGGELKDQFLSGDKLLDYLTSKTVTSWVKASDLYIRELRVGIRLSSGRRTAEEGMFYMPEFVRLQKGMCLCISLDGVDDLLQKETDLLGLGGESRAAVYRKCDRVPPGFDDLQQGTSILQKLGSSNPARLKLYFAAPAIFRQGWLPDFINSSSLIGEIDVTTAGNKIKLQLISAAVGKALPIGGWNLAKNAPKPLLRAMPPGSVYFFKLLEGDVQDVFNAFHFKCRAQEEAKGDNLKELAKIGFGLTFVGCWDYANAEEV